MKGCRGYCQKPKQDPKRDSTRDRYITMSSKQLA